jgi:hypothetical protein
MTNTTLRTANPDWGFWGTSVRNGYDAALAWEAASDALATAFDLTPAEIRDLLDSRFGRHLADDLSFIPGGPASREAIEEHIMARLAVRSWRRWFDTGVRAIRTAHREARGTA